MESRDPRNTNLLWRLGATVPCVPCALAMAAVLGMACSGIGRGNDDLEVAHPAADAAEMRRLLSLYGIDETYWQQQPDDQPSSAHDAGMAKLLYHLARLPPEQLVRGPGGPATDLAAVAEAPASHRAARLRLTGRVVRVEGVAVPPDMAPRVGFTEFYRVEFQVPGGPPVLVCSRQVPSGWASAAELAEPAEAAAVFVTRCLGRGGIRQLMFAAPRIAWYPDAVRAAVGATRDHVFLAGLRVDIALLCDEQMANGRPLLAADRESFYELLGAMRITSSRAILAGGARPLPLDKLLVEPERHHGELCVVEGHARQITKVLVPDPDIRRRFGIDHYYQIDLFVPLDRQVIRLTGSTTGDDAPTFADSFPVTLCVPSLPEGLQAGSNLSQDLRAAAAFFKVWAYPSDYVASFGRGQQQLSPMLIGTRPEVVTADIAHPPLGIALAIVLLLAMAVVWLGLIRRGRKRSVVRRVLGEGP